MNVKMEDIIVFDAKSKRLFGNDELMFSQNGNALQVTINVADFMKVVTGSSKSKGGSSKRKPSAWNKYVKANSKKPRFRYRNGKLNLKKMAVAFRKTPQGKKKRR